MTDKLLPCPFCGGNPEHMSTSSSWVRCEDCCAEIQCRETKEDAVQMWNTRALSVPAPSGGGVEVKKLEWHHHDGNYPTWRTYHYQIRFEAVIDRGCARMYGEYPLSINGSMSKEKFDTLEAAQSAAQADYEKRILSAISTPTKPDEDRMRERGWTKVPEEPTLEFLRSINIDNQVLVYENGRYYNAWFTFEQSEGGWYWTDDADSEPNPSHYMALPAAPVLANTSEAP